MVSSKFSIFRRSSKVTTTRGEILSVRCFTSSCIFKIFRLTLDPPYSLESQEPLHLHLQILPHISLISILFESLVLCLEQSLYVVIMVLGRTLSIHLRIVIEEVRVDFVKEGWNLKERLLHEDKGRRGNPVEESSCWPLMSKG